MFSKGVEASRLGHHCMNGLNFLKRVSMQDNMRLFLLLQCHSRSKRLHLARVAHLGRSVTFVQEERQANLCLFIYRTCTCHTVCVVYMYICTQAQKHVTQISALSMQKTTTPGMYIYHIHIYLYLGIVYIRHPWGTLSACRCSNNTHPHTHTRDTVQI